MCWEEAGFKNSYSMSKLGLHLLANYITAGNFRDDDGDRTVIGIAVNPGAVNSSIWRGSNTIVQWVARHVFLTSEQGCYPSVYAAASPTIAIAATRQSRFLYVTPYVSLCGGCIRRAPVLWCRRVLVLLSNVGEAMFGRCLYGRARFGEMSFVAMDELEAERLWKFAQKEVARRKEE